MKLAPCFGGRYLVGLLVVLLGGEIVLNLRQEGVEGHALKVIGPEGVSRYVEHFLKGVHHFHGGAELAAAGGAAPVEHLVPRPKAGGKAYGVADGLNGLFGSLKVLCVMGILPPHVRGLESLPQVNAVHTPLVIEDVTIGKGRCPVVCL